jgi:PIN like domain
VQPPEPFTFLLDRCLGTIAVPAILKPALATGEELILLDDHFPPNTLDANWIPVVGSKGWVIITKDSAMRRNPLEINALLAAQTAVFFFSNCRVPANLIGDALALALPSMRTAIRRFKVPMMGRVSASSDLSILYSEGEELKPPRSVKVRRFGQKK